MIHAARFSINRPMPRKASRKRRKTTKMYGTKQTRKVKREGLIVKFVKWGFKTIFGIFNVEMPKHVSHEIFFVLALAVFLLSILALNNNAGPVGDLWLNISTYSIGKWGLYTLIAWLGITGSLHFILRIDNLARGTMLMGFLIFLSSLTALFSKSFVNNGEFSLLYENLREVGGHLGFYTLFALHSALGDIGSTVILFGMAIIGFVMMSHVGISDLVHDILLLLKKLIFVEDNETSITIREGDFLEESNPKFKTMQLQNEDPETGTTTKLIDHSQIIKPKRIKVKEMSPIANDDIGWLFPPIELLSEPTEASKIVQKALEDNANLIKEKLSQFSINVEVKEVEVGPTVIQYAVKPDESVKLSKIIGLKQDLALALATPNIRIEAPIHGKSLVGIEIPKPKRTPVMIRELLDNLPLGVDDESLLLPLGKDASGKPVLADLADMPHLLIAGSTGSGKSVCVNSIIVSLLYQRSPKTLKLIMVDPKHVELTNYNGLPHLLTPVITDPGKAIGALKWACSEMDRRYKELSKSGARNLAEYHQKIDQEQDEYMPTIVVVIDELADLMMSGNKKETESYICRIAQKARAVGIHLIVATQRPSVDVITGLIKANFPTRIAFAVTAGVDSKTILDSIGAEDLLGKGDMLYLPKDLAKPLRVQGCLVSSKEIEGIMRHIRLHSIFDDGHKLEFDDDGSEIKVMQADGGLGISSMNHGEGTVTTLDIMEAGDDDNLLEALRVVGRTGKASASLLQRSLRVGYARAASILDQLEEKGLIGPSKGAKPRDIFLDKFPVDILEEINEE